MRDVLVDTSVWIDALNGKTNWQTKLLEQLISDDPSVVLCPVIIQEILQGIRDDNDFNTIKADLSGFVTLYIDPVEAAYGAAALYRNIRKRGVTIRKSNDCLIAYYAISCEASLLHNDADFDKIAAYSALKLLKE